MDSRPKHVFKCSVTNCKNSTRNSNYVFYCFPSANPHFPHKAQRREHWLKVLNKSELDGSAWIPNKRSRICSFHFAGNKKSENPESPSYNPTVFDDSARTLQRAESSVNRFHRVLKKRIASSRVCEGNNKEVPEVNSQLQDGPTKRLSCMPDDEEVVVFVRLLLTQLGTLRKSVGCRLMGEIDVLVADKTVGAGVSGLCEVSVKQEMDLGEFCVEVKQEVCD